jgi:hypothetical protein
MNLEIQKAIFDHRHSFDSEDIIVLRNYFPNITFEQIPDAWIIPIDNFLRSISDIKNIQSISQVYGMLFCNYSNLSITDIDKLKKLEVEVSNIDYDLFHQVNNSELN